MKNYMKLEALAMKYQQYYYELLPDWFLYSDNDYDYIKQQIALALFSSDIDESKINDIEIDNKMFMDVIYNKKSYKIIEAILKQILQYGKQVNNDGTSFIYLGIIYNIVFNHSANLKAKNDVDTTPNEIYALPIFKIKRDMNTIWYIDIGARIYKDWEDYLSNNMLPKCIMVLPKNGKYQCNINATVTKYSSMVWLEQMQSPACKSNIAVNAAGTTVNVLGIASSIGLGVASFFTPVGPVLSTAGLISCGISGTWNIVRSMQKLVDLGKHKESLMPTNLSALSAWFGISTSVLSVGTNSGNMILLNAISNGSKISNSAKIAYNSLVISNLAVHGIGIAFQGCHLVDQCRKKKEVELIDIFMFSSHILFFSNAIINMKLAGELIGTSNGTVFDKFKDLIRFKRLQVEYNRICNIENDNSNGIIYTLRRISSRMDFLKNFNVGNLTRNVQLNFQNGKVEINGITILNPILLAEQLLTTGMVALLSDPSLVLNMDTMSVLKSLLSQLLKNFYSEQRTVFDEKSEIINRFDDMLREMYPMQVNNAINILKMVFKMGVHLAQLQRNPVQYLEETVLFVWEYVKTNLKQNCLDKCTIFKANTTVYNILIKVVTKIFQLIDELTYDLYLAFQSFISKVLPLEYQYKDN